MPSEGNKPAPCKVTPPYRYQALPPGPYIRILHLQPGRAGDRMICSLQAASLEEAAGRYDALSYEWGPSSQVCAIEVDDCLLYIRANLFSQLDLIRERDEVIRIWVDAIRIDQNSIEEKNHQVQQMWSVYFNGSRTRVFLNIDADRPELWDERWKELVSNKPQQAERAIWKGLGATYWTRLWIVQEITASNQITVQVSNSRSVPWVVFFEQCRMVAEYLGEPPEYGTGIPLDRLATSGINDLHGHTRAVGYDPVRHGKATPERDDSYLRGWAELIRTYRRKGCLDKRDHVYGLNGSARTPVKVDYGLHALEVFVNVMNADHDFETVRYAEDFAEVLWRALGLHHASTMDVQLYSGLLVPLKLQRVVTRLTPEIIIQMAGRRRNYEEHDDLFTLSPLASWFYSIPPIPLLVLPRMPHFYAGKDNQTFRHPSCCTGVALTAQQAQDVPLPSLNGLIDSLEGARVYWDFDDPEGKEATIGLSVLAYHYARTVFNLDPLQM